MSIHCNTIDNHLLGDQVIAVPVSVLKQMLAANDTQCSHFNLIKELFYHLPLEKLSLEEIKTLVSLGLPHDLKLTNGLTMLEYYAKSDQVEIVKYLAGLIAIDKDKLSLIINSLFPCKEIPRKSLAVLFLEFYEDHPKPELISFLLKCICNPDYQDTEDFNQKFWGHSDDFEPRMLEIFVRVIKRLADLLDPNAKSLLYHYAELGRLDLVTILVDLPKSCYTIKTVAGKCLSEIIYDKINGNVSEAELGNYKKIYNLVREH